MPEGDGDSKAASKTRVLPDQLVLGAHGAPSPRGILEAE